MKSIIILLLFFTSFIYLACDAGEVILDSGSPLPLITLDDAESRDYDLRTLEYGIQVSIREDVGGNDEDILDNLDEMATNFLGCQFGEGAGIGFDDFISESGEIIPSLSQLRVFVVPFTFDCEAVGRDTCDGIYYFGPDLIINAREERGTCDNFALWKHELGHRYGMAADHSNQGQFEPCINPPGCLDLPFGIGD